MSEQCDRTTQGWRLYKELPKFAAERRALLCDLLGPYVAVTDAYGGFTSWIVRVLGEKPPESTQDRVARDLTVDVFGFLYEAREMILQAKTVQAFPLTRRAYESMTLLTLCLSDGSVAEAWHSGVKITNAEVRSRLARLPVSEPEEDMRVLYKIFSQSAHPNRDRVPCTLLGEGNTYVLGAFPQPDPVVTIDYCQWHAMLWRWFLPAVCHFYFDLLLQADDTFPAAFVRLSGQAKDVREWLAGQLEEQLRQRASSEEAQ